MRACSTMLVCLAATVSLSTLTSVAAEQPAGQAVVVLDTYGNWRMHHTLAPPLIQPKGGEPRPVLYGYEWIDCQTPAPPEGWTAPNFDDSSWLRGPAHMACHTPYLARLCLRGYFGVTDPAQAGDLTLTLVHQGGAVVYLNGKEVARGHLPKDHAELADPYPLEAFVDDKGQLLRGWDKKVAEQNAESLRRIALRTRELRDVRLPRNLLRRGTNVLAVELVRSAYPPEVELGRPPKGSWVTDSKQSLCEFNFNTCELIGLQLVAAAPGGIVPNAVRAAGLHVWNGDVMAGDFDLDFGGQAGEPLRPVRIVAARNGDFSGKFVVGSTEAIRKLRVTVGNLSSGRATIPASAVQVRYGRPWGSETYAFGALMGGYEKGVNASLTFRYPRYPTLLGALWDAPPEEIAVEASKSDRGFAADARLAAPPPPVFGAVVPVWLTVRVPKTAAPGLYVGRAAVQVEGQAPPQEVRLEVKVSDWVMPDPGEFRTWIDIIQSPDTLSVEYATPLWSERHWELIARSMDLLHSVGNRVLYVPLIAQCNHGNAESMVRWIDRGGGQYDWDFSVMDKYLDLCLRHMGRPSIVVLYVWDIYLAESKQLKPGFDAEALGADAVKAREAMKGKGPMVTVVDPAPGKVETRHLPVLSAPESKPLWKGLFAAMRSHIQERGLGDRLMLGTMSDAWPSKADADFFAEVAGDFKWFSDSHTGIAEFKRDMEAIASGKASQFTRQVVYPTVKDGKAELSVLERAGYCASVFSVTLAAENKTGEGRHGWMNPWPRVQHDRHADVHPVTRWHFMPELNILGEQGGVGRLGGDWWDCVRSRGGWRSGNVRQRYPHASWRNLDMNVQMLAPGPEGAVATQRFENLRQGVQECEARIFIEQALLDPAGRQKLGPELAKAAGEVLRRRANFLTKTCSNLQMSGVGWDNITDTRGFYKWPNVAGHCWLLSADWPKMNEELFDTAAAVAAALQPR